MVSLFFFEKINYKILKQLFIVRHAKSSWDNPQSKDIDRPLNNRGKRDVPRMAEFLKTKIKCPQVLISSPAVRALQTTIGFTEKLDCSESSIIKSPKLYHASVADWLDVISQINEDNESAMLFGHNPGITALVNRITDSNIYNIPTCGVAGIKLNIYSWSDIEKKKGELEFYYYPKGIYL